MKGFAGLLYLSITLSHCSNTRNILMTKKTHTHTKLCCPVLASLRYVRGGSETKAVLKRKSEVCQIQGTKRCFTSLIISKVFLSQQLPVLAILQAHKIRRKTVSNPEAVKTYILLLG